MKIVVIENNNVFNMQICKYINQVLIENNKDYDVVSFLDYNNQLNIMIHDREIKIYVVDLKLGKYSAYDVCRQIRESAYDWNSIIIISSFHNAKEDFISMRLAIFTYLSKKINFEQNLKESVLAAINILEKTKFLSINKNCKISINDICYILKEKNSKYCFIQTLNDDYRIRKSLKSLEEELRLTRKKNYLLINENNVVCSDKNKILFQNNIEINL